MLVEAATTAPAALLWTPTLCYTGICTSQSQLSAESAGSSSIFMNRNRIISCLCAGLLAVGLLPFLGCGQNLYPFPQYNFAGRPIPPSDLSNRVLVAIQNPSELASGSLQILDANNDLRHNIENTILNWPVQGYGASLPSSIQNFPAELTGYVYGAGDGSFVKINYGVESGLGNIASEPSRSNSIMIDGEFKNVYAAIEIEGYFTVADLSTDSVYALNLPNVYQVATNSSGTIALAMVRNSNTLYRAIQLPTTSNIATTAPAGAIDCRPTNQPLWCLVPVPTAPGTLDHPIGAIFSLDGTQVYILNCGPECGGTTASVSYLSTAPLLENVTTIPTTNQVLATTPVPGGVTTAISDGTYLYVAGQQLQSTGTYAGLFAGNLSIISPTQPASQTSPVAPTVTSTYSISDGLHTKMIFGDNDTLWIGSNTCADGVRQAKAAAGLQTQAANYNCLTRFVISPSATNPILPSWTANTSFNLGSRISDGTNIEVMAAGNSTYTLNSAVITNGFTGATTPSWNTTLNGTTTDNGITWVDIGPVTQAEIIPGITPNSSAFPVPIQWLNANGNPYYYGDLTGICWVQGLNKMYTAYGGQIHLFGTADGGEHDNSQITIQGTAADVAYMDALTDGAN
jgi:hypothetical protein